jgi:hypothetical protein
MLIGGRWVESGSSELIETPDPATGKIVGQFPAGTVADADAAVAAARRAFNGPWRKITPYERGRLLQKVASLLEANSEELAQLITLDNGKPIAEARKEVTTAISWTDYYAGWATKLTGETIPLSLPGNFLNYTVREPLGVVGCEIRGRGAEVGPPKPKVRSVCGCVEIGCRGDGPEPRHRESPADAVVRLPVDDLLDRRQSPGHALSGSPHASASTG